MDQTASRFRIIFRSELGRDGRVGGRGRVVGKLGEVSSIMGGFLV